jgi:hypothetical protein
MPTRDGWQADARTASAANPATARRGVPIGAAYVLTGTCPFIVAISIHAEQHA